MQRSSNVAKILAHRFAITSNYLSAIEWPRTGVTGLWRKLYLHRTKGPVGGRHEIFRESSCRAWWSSTHKPIPSIQIISKDKGFTWSPRLHTNLNASKPCSLADLIPPMMWAPEAEAAYHSRNTCIPSVRIWNSAYKKRDPAPAILNEISTV